MGRNSQGNGLHTLKQESLKTFNRPTGRKSDSKQCPITANSIAKLLLANGHFRGANKQHDLYVKR